MRKGKDHMKVRGVNDFSPAFVHPDLFVDNLTVRTVTVTAGIVMEFQMTAVRTLGNVHTQSARLTVHDSSGSFFLDIRLERTRSTVIRIRRVPDLVYFGIIHVRHLPSCQKG
jgi:hypothetical protein